MMPPSALESEHFKAEPENRDLAMELGRVTSTQSPDVKRLTALYEFGGHTRDHLECYKSTAVLSIKTAGEEGRKSMDEGFRAIRFFVIGSGGNSGLDARRAIGQVAAICAVLREGMGPEGEFIFDAHTRFNLADCVQLCERVNPYYSLFIEAPLNTLDDCEAFAMLRQKVSVPLAAGEQFGDSRHGNLPLIERNLINFFSINYLFVSFGVCNWLSLLY